MKIEKVKCHLFANGQWVFLKISCFEALGLLLRNANFTEREKAEVRTLIKDLKKLNVSS